MTQHEQFHILGATVIASWVNICRTCRSTRLRLDHAGSPRGPYRDAMARDSRQTVLGAVLVTLAVLGVGLVVSVLVGFVVGYLIDDLARGLGRSVAIGMSIAAVVGVAASLLVKRRDRSG
jgi:F0F1-type ATP synthase assembly protein I